MWYILVTAGNLNLENIPEFCSIVIYGQFPLEYCFCEELKPAITEISIYLSHTKFVKYVPMIL